MIPHVSLLAGEPLPEALTVTAREGAVSALRIVLILLIAVVLRFVVHRSIRKLVERAATRTAVPEALRQRLVESSAARERRRQRAETIGSVLRSIATVVIFSVAFTTVLSELDVNLGPILASAGIIGVAVGFGAQALVKDFLNGIFMILEDQYGVGDLVDVGAASGVVEAVGLRVTRLRNPDGTVWHVRNGEVLRVGNLSQGCSRALLDVVVAPVRDVEHAQRVVVRVVREVWQSEEVGDLVLDEPEVSPGDPGGADRLGLRLALRTVPLAQLKVAHELRQRLKQALAEQGVAGSKPQLSLWLRTDADAAPMPVPDPEAAAPAGGAEADARPAT